jgi:hypothetical protein
LQSLARTGLVSQGNALERIRMGRIALSPGVRRVKFVPCGAVREVARQSDIHRKTYTIAIVW